MKIVSGGQTGVDRGALLAALDCGVPCGGWCPEDRQAEDGRIPDCLPVTPLAGAGYPGRTIKNVADSDATVVIYSGELAGGTQLTVQSCRRQGKPCLLLDAQALTEAALHNRLSSFLTGGYAVVNVAGPRASAWPEAQSYARRALSAALKTLAGR